MATYEDEVKGRGTSREIAFDEEDDIEDAAD